MKVKASEDLVKKLIQSYKFDSLSSIFYALARIAEENQESRIYVHDMMEVMIFESFEYSEELYNILKDSLDKYYIQRGHFQKAQVFTNTKGEGFYFSVRGVKSV